MNVWVVIAREKSYVYNDPEIAGVYSSREIAVRAMQRLTEDYKLTSMKDAVSFQIEEYKVFES